VSWQLASLAVLSFVLLGGFGWYERRRPPARVVALVAALAALAVVGRLAFAAIPNVKPTTDIVLFAGYALGAVPGFAVGAVTALVSNIFLGQGPWTAWQMTAWGGVGIAGAGLARAARGRELGRLPLAIACGLAGLVFGAVLDVYQWTLAARQDLPTYLAISGSSLPYNLAHAIGNVGFCLLIGPAFIRALGRYRRRFEVRWAPPRTAATTGAAAAVVLVLAAGVALATAPTERARAAGETTAGPTARAAATASPSTRAVRYLMRAQNRDGGLGGARGQRSNQLFTGWAGLGLAAARRNPRDVARPRGRALTTYLRRAGGLKDTGELERTILVLKASGLSPRRFAGRDLVAELVRRQRADGTWQRNVTFTAFGVMALRAAGHAPASGSVQRAANALQRAQNGDGGFGFVASAQSDVDDTGAALQALAAAGRRSGPVVRKAVAYLRGAANGDGGFGQMNGRSSNAQSTSWAVQGLVAAGVGLESGGRSPTRYLAGLQRRDGHFSYSRTSNQTPVWVTAQALTAVRRKPFPIATVPRKRRPRPARASTKAAAGARAKARPRKHDGRSRSGEGQGEASIERRGTATPAQARESRRVKLEQAAAEGEGSGGVPPLALVAGALAALALVVPARRWLRRRGGLQRS
jgi:prenyltransferase beta subunit